MMKKLYGIMLKAYRMQTIKIIKPMIIGSNTVQQKDINWSYLILGREALIHINMKIKKQTLKLKKNV